MTEDDTDLWLLELQDHFDELVDRWNQADDNEYIDIEELRGIMDKMIDVMKMYVDRLRIFGFNLNLMNDALLSVKGLDKTLKEARDVAKKKDSSNDMFL